MKYQKCDGSGTIPEVTTTASIDPSMTIQWIHDDTFFVFNLFIFIPCSNLMFEQTLESQDIYCTGRPERSDGIQRMTFPYSLFYRKNYI